jgi:hypothetical protein
MGEMKRAYKICVRYLKRRQHLGEVSAHGKIILKWVLMKYDVRVWIRFIWLRIGISGGVNTVINLQTTSKARNLFTI